MPEETKLISPQYWLAELDQYGNPKLVDGSHGQRSGVVAAMDIYRKCGFDKGRKFAVAKVELFPVYREGGDMPEEKVSTCPSCQATDNNPYTGANGVSMRACGRCMIQWVDAPPAADAGPRPEHTSDCCLDLDHKGDCRRWMRLLENSYRKGIHIQDDGCPKAGCRPASRCEIEAYLGHATAPPVPQEAAPAPVVVYCPACQTLHIDEGEWATRPHKTHKCQKCELEWRPYPYATVGVDPLMATAPDWAMRVARLIVPSVHENYAFDDTLPEREAVYAHVAALIREAGSERERVASATARLDQFLRMKGDRPLDPVYWDAHEERRLREELAEASRLLGGESK